MPGLYLHIPFCEQKCIYCDFYSVAPQGGHEKFETLMTRFAESLSQEITLRGSDEKYRTRYSTIFFGGGTPSLLSPSKVGEILDLLHSNFSIDATAEITLETNPGTVDLQRLQDFRNAGINRISMGIQSFFDDDLKFLSRIHSAREAKECVKNAFKAGFENVSFDLIFSLPTQTLERWESNLQQAVELNPSHISCYSLIVEPDTPLQRMVAAKQIAPLSEDADAEMYRLTIDFLSHHNFEQYEVSNFARNGFKCLHNLTYWNHDHYLGFGPSAHSFWNGKRFWNIANVVHYSDSLDRGILPEAGFESLSEEQLLEEAVFLGFRSEGLDLESLRKRYRRDLLKECSEKIETFVSQNLLQRNGQRLRLTRQGYPLCDEICSALV
jgi:oxygen-independent coproporphyrinogen-3 oxidase